MRSRPCCQPSRIFFERYDPPLPPRQRTPFAGGMALKLLRLRLCRRCSLSRYRRHRRCLFRRRCLYSRLSRLHHLYSRLIWCRHCNHCLIWHCDHSSGGWGKPAWAPPINPADISSLAINTNIVGRGPARHTRLISPVALPRPLCAPGSGTGQLPAQGSGYIYVFLTGAGQRRRDGAQSPPGRRASPRLSRHHRDTVRDRAGAQHSQSPIDAENRAVMETLCRKTTRANGQNCSFMKI